MKTRILPSDNPNLDHTMKIRTFFMMCELPNDPKCFIVCNFFLISRQTCATESALLINVVPLALLWPFDQYHVMQMLHYTVDTFNKVV